MILYGELIEEFTLSDSKCIFVLYKDCTIRYKPYNQFQKLLKHMKSETNPNTRISASDKL